MVAIDRALRSLCSDSDVSEADSERVLDLRGRQPNSHVRTADDSCGKHWHLS